MIRNTRAHLALLLVQTAWCTLAMDQLQVVFEWKQLDFDWPSTEQREVALNTSRFIPENNVPTALDVHTETQRLFLAVPRWRDGIPSTLNYVKLDGNETSPKLIPYPNWEAQDLTDSPPSRLASVVNLRVDSCSRLWVLDEKKNNLDNSSTIVLAIFVYNLTDNTLIRHFNIKNLKDYDVRSIAVDDTDCNNSFAYISDMADSAIITYSWKSEKFWTMTSDEFKPDPQANSFSVNGYNYTEEKGLLGLSLSSTNPDGYRTLYFHPLSSFQEFSISTEYLRNESLAKINQSAIKVVGSRGDRAQSSASFLDANTGVLFYSLVNLNAVACWRTSNTYYNMSNQGRIYVSNTTMVNPSDIKIDQNHNLWVLSNKWWPAYRHVSLDKEEVNFRVFSAPVSQAVNGTACDVPRLAVTSTTTETTVFQTSAAPVSDQNSPAKESSAPAITMFTFSSVLLLATVAVTFV